MPQLSTGLIIAGAYADKLRRVLFAQLKNDIKSGKIDSKQVARRAGEMNRLLFEILVNRLKLDKGDAVRIRVEYELRDGDIVWRLNTLRIEAFRRIPDSDIEKAIRDVVEKAEDVLARPETEEERLWTTRTEAEVEHEIKESQKQEKPPVELAEAIVYGRTRRDEHLAILKDENENNVGLAILSGQDNITRIVVVLVPGKDAYKTELTVDTKIEELSNNPEKIVEAVKHASFEKISRSEAEKIIREKMEEML
ncbi:hypothetical protein Pyrde_1107 [Pyrodictium delaneyi]|uniref:DUF2258 domain-containing protein n=1 Tax=Pyrodictium delaneyi TaxID=1273541 RepID=A0A0P0N349_9CREN|nr:DUF2258 domain-containing protein [Pyrodictium delaneyi]ALL01155.1 hypothetical protein Pyrde_1107 [Pyrodictium delaneyi]